MLKEKNYDFRARHWQYHRPGMRQSDRRVQPGEVEITQEWSIGCAPDALPVVLNAVKDFQDYFFSSMDCSVRLTHTPGKRVVWLETGESLTSGFRVNVAPEAITITLSQAGYAFRAIVHLEDWMNLEGAPVLPEGVFFREPLYEHRSVHSGCGIDEYPDAELAALVHAGYDEIQLMMKGPDMCTQGPVNVNDLCNRAEKFGISVFLFNYIQTYLHPDEAGVQEKFDRIYGDFLRRYPKVAGLGLCGESLEFPSKDPHTTGKKYQESVIDGIPETKPAPGWYPCYDYPAYIQCIERAAHKVNPKLKIVFDTYNWGWAPLELREKFLANFPKNVTLMVCYEIFSQKKLGDLRTPIMDYSISVLDPGYYFTSECEAAAKYHIPLQGNVNTAGIAWNFGCVPWVPTPERWLYRDLKLREAKAKWNLSEHYTTHHYGWWATPAADLGRWSAWANFEPDYAELLKKIAVRDYGKAAAPHVLEAWKLWSHAMDFYTASNEDQYGPWRVGPAYPFIFHPNITRTMSNKEIKFPTVPYAHFGHSIIKTFYQPFENIDQSPGFLRYPLELKSLAKMLELWEAGLKEAGEARGTDEGERLYALGLFIRNSIRTTMNIKRWWQLNMAMQNSKTAPEALELLDAIEAVAHEEIENAQATIPAVETDSRIGWEPSMEYVCDRWHLEWKIRQVESALREIAEFRRMLQE